MDRVSIIHPNEILGTNGCITGLNCGFEDVRILMEVLESSGALPPPRQASYGAVSDGPSAYFRGPSLKSAMEEYSRVRYPALQAIQQLAQDNYDELRHGVVSPSYLARRWLDEKLMQILPMVSMPRLSISASKKNGSQQWLLDQGHEHAPADAIGPWKSRYMLVTFSNVPYHKAMRQVAIQDTFITITIILLILLLFLVLLLAARRSDLMANF